MVYDKDMCLMYYKKKYEYMNTFDIELLYNIAQEMLLNLKYPFEYDIDDATIKKEQEKHPTWCLRCMQEMIDKTGISNVVGYSENGVSVKFDKTGLSQSLIDEIVGQAGIV